MKAIFQQDRSFGHDIAKDAFVFTQLCSQQYTFTGVELAKKILYFMSLLYLSSKYNLKSDHQLNKLFNMKW